MQKNIVLDSSSHTWHHLLGRHSSVWNYRLHLAAVIALLFGLWFFVYTSSRLLVLEAPAQTVTSQRQAVDKPIQIQYQQLIKTPQLSVSPKTDGQWSTSRTPVGTTLTFTTSKAVLASGTTYTVTATNVESIVGKKLPDQTFTVITENAADVERTQPKQGDTAVSRTTNFSLTLKGANKGMRAFSAKITPEAAINYAGSEDDKTFTWVAKEPLKQGASYTFVVYDTNDPSGAPVAKSEFTVAAAPTISSATQKNLFYDTDTITIVFSKPMAQDQAILTGLQGTGGWKDPANYEFKPTGLTVNKKYTYTVPAQLRATDGSVLEQAASYWVATPGAVQPYIVSLGSDASRNPKVEIRFDQPVKRETAESRVSISPSVAGNFTWLSDTSVQFMPAQLEEQASYTVTVAGGVEPVRFGLPGVATAMEFTTKPPVTKLGVPLYKQQHISSCEAAAARMALAYRGISAKDSDIVQRFGYNPRPIDKSTNSWDDPNDMYVGNIDGPQAKLEGYGAYAAPIAKGIKTYGRDATAHYGISAQFIAEQIWAGNPVITIGTYGGAPRRVTWNGPNGVVNAWYGEHARVVVGVVGKASNPVGFYVHDPLVSGVLYWSKDKLMDDLSAIPQVPTQVVVVK